MAKKQLTIKDVSTVRPNGCMVNFVVIDKLTGKVLNRFKQKPNSATPMAKEVAARVLGGSRSEVSPGVFNPYTAAFIEWGQGHTNPTYNATNPDLETPFSTPVITPLEEPIFTGVKGQVKFYSSIDDSAVALGTSIQEVGLRTAPVVGHPKGILIARFQNDSPITVSNNRVKVGVEWIYIYL